MFSCESSRREFLLGGGALLAAAFPANAKSPKPVVSIVRIRDGRVARAVEKAIDLLGGMRHITRHVQTVMLKPNLVSTQAEATTKTAVVRTLAELMQRSGKQVSIGEGSAAAPKFNVLESAVYRTRKREILDPMQQYVFDQLGYSELAKTLRVPLVNLHSGRLVEVRVPGGGFVYDRITLHHSLAETDMLCSVPMMKTHQLATVTLGMKNLVGAFPGAVYQSVRGHMHDEAARVEPTGASAVVVDMVRANKLGLVVIDGSMAMEGNGPSMGRTFRMDVILAGTNPVAVDMAGAAVMGFEPADIPTFAWANQAGMGPRTLDEIEIRGEKIGSVRRTFARPQLQAWNAVRNYWGNRELTRNAPATDA